MAAKQNPEISGISTTHGCKYKTKGSKNMKRRQKEITFLLIKNYIFVND